MLKQITLRKYVLFLCFVFFLQTNAAAQFRYGGYVQQYLLNGPQYINPAIVDWRREYWVGGQPFSTESPPVGWGGTRVSLQTFWGRPEDSFYLQLPFLFTTGVTNKGVGRLKLLRSGSFAFKIKSDQLGFTMSSYRVGANQQWSYIDLKDPLGALKLPGTSAPMLTIKLTGIISGWELTNYYLADNKCIFIPKTEIIPQRVFDVLGKSEQQMKFFDEVPTYQMSRGIRKTDLGSFGILWGQKTAENLNPRATDSENTLPNPSHGVGYVKENVGMDFISSLSSLNGSVLAAAIRSSGDWYKYGKQNQPTEHLGKVLGDAIKLELRNLKFNSWLLNSSYIMVEPTFQWVAVRDSRYAHVYSFCDPQNPNYSYVNWRTVRDDDFRLRDLRRKDDYLSDVSTYLGLRAWNVLLDYPGCINVSKTNSLPVNFSLELQDLINLNGGKRYYDSETGEEMVKDYRQVKACFEGQGSKSNLILTGLQRDYKVDRDYLQELSATFSKNLDKQIVFTTNGGITKRLRGDDSFKEGMGWRFDTNLSGKLRSSALYSVGVDYRSGCYDYGLMEGTKDHVLELPYTYLAFSQYYEGNKNINLGAVPIRATVAAEMIRRDSSILELNGTSMVFFYKGVAKLSPSLTATAIWLDVLGPQVTSQIDKFPSNSLNNALDCVFNYQLFGSSSNSIMLRFTRRFLGEATRDNIYVTFTSRVGSHSLSLRFGQAPIGGPTSYIAGTKYDIRLDNPPEEIYQRPWEIWGLQGIRSDETYPYTVFTWTIYF